MNKQCTTLIFMTAVGCTDVKSSSVNTDGMYLNYSVATEGEGTGTTVDVLLRVGGLTSTTYVDLSEEDQLTVSVNDESQLLAKRSLGVVHSYVGTFATDVSESQFLLNFDRSALTSAPNSVATLPNPFALTSPEADTVLSVSDTASELLIAWDNEGDDSMSIEVSGECFTAYVAEESSDSGNHSIPVSYFSENALEESPSCEATVVVERRRSGTLDPAFGDGQVVGLQRRTATISLQE